MEESFDPTYDELEAVACGEVGLKVDYFYSLTPREFDNILTGYRRKEENLEKANWDRARYGWFYTIIAFNGSKEIKKPSDLLQFPWENVAIDEAKKPMSKKELQAYFEKLDLKKSKKIV